MPTEPGRVAMVTGSSRGIGYEVAGTLGLKGYHIVLNSRHSEEVEAAATSLRSIGIEVTPMSLDVSKASEVHAGFLEIERSLGGVDILVNNAGITRDKSFTKTSFEDWNEVIENNLTSVFLCCKRALIHMIDKRWGRIVNISSIVGQYGAFGQVSYAASKAGIIGFTKALAKEVATKGITVNAVAPGYISTAMTAQIPASVAANIKERIPFGAFGPAESVANVVLFLSSEESGYMTGSVINIDGGF